MEEKDAALAAGFETTVFLGSFKDLPDHRQAGKVTYPLDEILLLTLLAVLAGAEGFTDIARFGEKKLSGRSPRAPRATIILAIFSRPSTPRLSGVVSSAGWRG